MSESDVVKASYWFPATDFPATDIDSSLFTHLFCTFADLEAESYEITIATWNQAPFHAFTETVQQRNPHVKTLLSIGGGNADKDAFASMASNPDSRASFIQSTITVARSYGFHGLDLDWEYPRNEEEMYDFGKLLEEWRSAVEAESNSSGTTALILTAAVYYSSNYQGVPYPVLAISNSLDWINLMAYDFYGPGWSTVTGPPASLYLPTDGIYIFTILHTISSCNTLCFLFVLLWLGRSGDSGVRDWTEAGLPAKKAVLGFPYYGWAWTLADPDVNGYDANTTGPAISDDGEISYRQLQTWIVDNGATKVHDDMMVGDYCYAGTTWIGYDSEKSIVTKVIYAKQKGLLGYFSWHVGGDDNSELSSAGSTPYHILILCMSWKYSKIYHPIHVINSTNWTIIYNSRKFDILNFVFIASQAWDITEME